MHIKTILNRIQKHKGFVYGNQRLLEEGDQLLLEIPIRARTGGRPVCSGCGRKGPGYDTLPARRFEFIPFWGILAYFVYAMRRVDCPRCGVKVERVYRGPRAKARSRPPTAGSWRAGPSA